MFKKINKYITLVLTIMGVVFSSILTCAYVVPPKCEDGIIIFTTQDKKATTTVKWSTIGFNIRRDKSGGNPLKDKNYTTLYLEPKWKSIQDKGDVVHVTFTIPKEDVDKALLKSGFEDIKDNDVIYLNGIFKVTEGSEVLNKEYHILKDIQKARAWSSQTLNDLEQRFDVEVKFKSGKYKVQIEYRTPDNVIIGSKEVGQFKAGKDIDVSLDAKKGNYELYRSYIINMSDPNTKKAKRKVGGEYTLAQVRKRTAKVKIGGLKFVAMMKLSDLEDVDIDVETIEEHMVSPVPTGIIAADNRGNEAYDVGEGIPSSEKLYANLFTTDYLIGYKLTKVAGKEVYPINVTKTYNLYWSEIEKDENGEDKLVDKSRTETVTKKINVERKYGYWIIENLEMYAIDSADVNNKALPGETVHMKADVPIPTVSYTQSNKKEDHIIHPNYSKSITLPSSYAHGSSVPNEDFLLIINSQIGEISVKNDKLVVNSVTVMSDKKTTREGPLPKKIQILPEVTEDNVLYTKGLEIPALISNGVYTSKGTVTYKSIELINSSKSNRLTYNVEGINSVTVHTPVVCIGEVEGAQTYNQMITPKKWVIPLVLDRSFSVHISTIGSHRNIKGYQYNEYKKYIGERQVKFPFDVYKGNEYILKDTWISISSKTKFFIPLWVEEGTYNIDFRSISINANGALNKAENYLNSKLSNYVATNEVEVEISGRLFGLNISDISDYPIWEKVFRQSKSLKHTGFNYPVGTKNQNGEATGIKSKYTLALVNGSHPEYSNQGVLKTGYAVRYSLTTMGNMWSDNCSVSINPRFYFVDRNGKNRTEVDVYYSETFAGKKQVLVKMGSDKDKLNVKKLNLGNSYLSVPQTEISNTANIRGISEKNLKGAMHSIFTYTNIKLPVGLRTFIGTTSNIKALNSVYSTIPATITSELRIKSLQRWYGEYYLPGEIHAVKKGFDVLSVAAKQSVNYKEDFWLSDGYIIINLEIETIKDGKKHLSYIATNKEYCNMWNMEGYQYTKTDSKGVEFNFEDGDFIMYYAGKSIANDYISGGTH